MGRCRLRHGMPGFAKGPRDLRHRVGAHGRVPRAVGTGAAHGRGEVGELAEQRAGVAGVDDLLDEERLGGLERDCARARGVPRSRPAARPDRRPLRAAPCTRPRCRLRAGGCPTRPTATRTGTRTATRSGARRRRRRRPCAGSPSTTAPSPGRPRRAPGRRGGSSPPARPSVPMTKPGLSTRCTTGSRNVSARSTKRSTLRDASAVQPPRVVVRIVGEHRDRPAVEAREPGDRGPARSRGRSRRTSPRSTTASMIGAHLVDLAPLARDRVDRAMSSRRSGSSVGSARGGSSSTEDGRYERNWRARANASASVVDLVVDGAVARVDRAAAERLLVDVSRRAGSRPAGPATKSCDVPFTISE